MGIGIVISSIESYVRDKSTPGSTARGRGCQMVINHGPLSM
jgi:hypothetical protein